MQTIIDRAQLDQPSAIIGAVLAQITDLLSPEYILIVAADVHRKWQEHRRERLDAQGLIREVSPELQGLTDLTAWTEKERKELHSFVDAYVAGVEAGDDLPQTTRNRLWFAYAQRLAPADHEINTGLYSKLGEDGGA